MIIYNDNVNKKQFTKAIEANEETLFRSDWDLRLAKNEDNMDRMFMLSFTNRNDEEVT